MTAKRILTALTYAVDEAKVEYEKAKDAEYKAEKSLKAAMEMYSVVVKTVAKDSRVAAMLTKAKEALEATEYMLKTVKACVAESAEKLSKATELLEDAQVLLADKQEGL